TGVGGEDGGGDVGTGVGGEDGGGDVGTGDSDVGTFWLLITIFLSVSIRVASASINTDSNFPVLR
ncbi:MAG: hypothetical protein CMB56_006690, partial [Methanobacteriota archaeon]